MRYSQLVAQMFEDLLGAFERPVEASPWKVMMLSVCGAVNGVWSSY